MIFGISGGKFQMQGGKFVNCACCGPVDCGGNPAASTFPLVFTFLCNQLSLTLTWSATAVGGVSPGWRYASGDVTICTGFALREVLLYCTGSTWNLDFVYTQGGIQFLLTTVGGSLNAITTVSASPMCLTTRSNGDYSNSCGTGPLYFAIGTCSVYPICPTWGSLPATATLTYTVGSMAQETMNLTQSGDTYTGSKTCDVGDGHNVIFQIFTVRCTSCLWSATLDQFILLDGVTTTSSATWTTPNFPPGTIQDSTLAISISPFHAHLAKNSSTGSTSGGSTKVCGGKTYPFGTGIAGVFDAVTP